MPATLKHVDPSRPPGRLVRLYSAFGGTHAARFISRHLNWKLDPLLLRLTRGRLSSTLMVPSGLLETSGARTGQPRRNAVIYFHDGDRVTIVASNAGHPRHPAWFHNLRAHPEVRFGGAPMRASEVTDESERNRLWGLADHVFPAFAKYRREAAATGRSIPVVQLTPTSE